MKDGGTQSTLIRGFAIVERIVQADRPLSSAYLAEELDLPKATVHRICQQLEDEGLLQREPGGKRFTGGKRLRQLKSGVEAEGWRFVAFVRLVPLFPFNLLNYALGLTNIRLSHYIVSSFIFMAPGGAAYTYLGYAGREVAGGGEDMVRKALLAIAVLASIAFASRILVRRHRRKTGEV